MRKITWVHGFIYRWFSYMKCCFQVKLWNSIYVTYILTESLSLLLLPSLSPSMSQLEYNNKSNWSGVAGMQFPRMYQMGKILFNNVYISSFVQISFFFFSFFFTSQLRVSFSFWVVYLAVVNKFIFCDVEQATETYLTISDLHKPTRPKK